MSTEIGEPVFQNAHFKVTPAFSGLFPAGTYLVINTQTGVVEYHDAVLARALKMAEDFSEILDHFSAHGGVRAAGSGLIQ